MVKRPPPKDLDAQAWVDAGLRAILEGGRSAVAIEPLARTLGVTKGSFYWHFRDRNALLTAMVDRWAQNTEELIARFSLVASPLERLEGLIAAVHHSEGVTMVRTMAALAGHEPDSKAIRNVATQQVAFIAQCFREMGLPPRRARAAAQVIQAATLGVGDLEPLGVGFGSLAERKAYVAELISFARAAQSAGE